MKKGKFVFEAFLCVENYMRGPFEDSPEVAFDICREDYPAVVKSAKVDIREIMGWKRMRKGLDFTVVAFNDFDSSNWTHATGGFDVEVVGPANMVADIEKAYEKSLE